MNVTARSYLTAGIAAVGAGAMALAPVQPIPDELALAPEKAISTLAVSLAASVDPWAAWGALIDDTAASVEGLHTSFWAQHTEDYSPPFPIFTSILLNQYTYFAEFPDISLIASQFFGNIGKFVKSGFTPSVDNVSLVQTGNIALVGKDHQALYGFMEPLVPDEYKSLLALTTTPMSGALLGFAGPGLSAMIQLKESIDELINAPTFDAKLQAFFDLAPKVFNAGLNGGKYLDLLPIVEKIIPDLPPGILNAIGIVTGGALTAYPYTKPNPGGYQAGGVAFDSVGVETALGNLAGIPIGLIGAIQSTMTFAARDIYIEPPGGGAAVPAPAAAVPAPAAAAVAPVEDAPAVVEDAPEVEALTAEVPEVEAPEVEAPEVEVPEVVTTGSSEKQTASAADNDSGSKGSSRAKRSSRGAA